MNSNLELLTLAGVLVVLSKLVIDGLNIGGISNSRYLQTSDLGKRIPPEKASLSGQRRAKRRVIFT